MTNHRYDTSKGAHNSAQNWPLWRLDFRFKERLESFASKGSFSFIQIWFDKCLNYKFYSIMSKLTVQNKRCRTLTSLSQKCFFLFIRSTTEVIQGFFLVRIQGQKLLKITFEVHSTSNDNAV